VVVGVVLRLLQGLKADTKLAISLARLHGAFQITEALLVAVDTTLVHRLPDPEALQKAIITIKEETVSAAISEAASVAAIEDL
jgi:hypothetical protein